MADQHQLLADFFVNYTGQDKAWAEWIAWQLEDAGYSVRIQAWDFGAGSNFVLEMQKAARESARTIAVLSRAYLASGFAGPEWAAAFRDDPTGAKGKLVPVRVEDFNPEGIIGPVVYIDLVGRDLPSAQQELLSRVQPGRAKPAAAPAFPGAATSSPPPAESTADSATDWHPVSTPVALLTRSEAMNNRFRSSSGAALVEIYLVPLPAQRLEVRQLAQLGSVLATAGRAAGLFDQSTQLGLETTDQYALANAPVTRTSGEAGLLVSRTGERAAWLPLPRDMMGSIFDSNELVPRITSALGLLLAIDLPTPDRFGVGLRMGPLTLVTLGSATNLGQRTTASMLGYNKPDLDLPVEDSFAGRGATRRTQHLAEELVARLEAAFTRR